MIYPKKYTVNVIIPKRKSHTGPLKLHPSQRETRMRIETTFSEFCNQFSIKKNFGKCFLGYFNRITSKIRAFTCLQYLNILNLNLLKHIKHSFAFAMRKG